MTRPHKHPKTGVYYFRQKTPADLVATFGRKEVSRSLGTKDAAEAKARHALAAAEQFRVWEAMRRDIAVQARPPDPLPHKQVVALAGVFYRDYMAKLDQEPGEVMVWETVLAHLDGVAATPGAAERWFGPSVDDLLRGSGIRTDDTSRARLLQEVERTFRQVAGAQMKRAGGDYSPDPNVARFPSLEIAGAAPELARLTLGHLFDLWERDHLSNRKSPRTPADYRQKVGSLVQFLGHDDARLVSPARLAAWCDHLRYETGLSARTVSEKYLVAIKSIYALAAAKHVLRPDPTKEVTVKWTKAPKTRPKGFTDDEAMAILSAALVPPPSDSRRRPETLRAIRWVPWICAFTGARITEATQLRREDLVEEKGVLCLRVTPEAGSVKTGNYRLVPIHPQLLDMGLPEVIRGCAAGPLFYSTEAVRGKVADPVERAQNAGAQVGTWVREVAGVTDRRVQPNHGWRHRFKTTARDVGIALEYADAITGHEDGRAATHYGETTMTALWREIQKLPRYAV